MDDEYLARKERRTAMYDKREMIPTCVITVSHYFSIPSGFYRHIIINNNIIIHMYLCTQEIRSRYPSMDGNYKDYVSTFEAESAAEFPPPMEM